MKIMWRIILILFEISALVKSNTLSTWWGADIQPKLSKILPKKMPKLPMPKALIIGITMLEPILNSSTSWLSKKKKKKKRVIVLTEEEKEA